MTIASPRSRSSPILTYGNGHLTARLAALAPAAARPPLGSPSHARSGRLGPRALGGSVLDTAEV